LLSNFLDRPKGEKVKPVILTIPTFGFIVATRAALGVGIGLLVSSRMPSSRRRQVGAALVAVGAATTIPAIRNVIRGRKRAALPKVAAVEQDRHLIGATRLPRRGDEIA
jgi:hypothetical protein